MQWPWPTIHELSKSLAPQTITILCGSPGASKSLMLIQSLAWWHRRRIKIAAMMLENTRAFHCRRALAQVARNADITDEDWIKKTGNAVFEIHDRYAEFLNPFEERIFEPPRDAEDEFAFTLEWMEREARRGARIIAIDPISLLDGGREQWIADKRLIKGARSIVEDYGASVILISHPRVDGDRPSIENVAGGKVIGRSVESLFWLEFLDDLEPVSVLDSTFKVHTSAEINRKLHVLKSRNGRGQGKVIGMHFKGDSLTFDEAGVIVKR